MSVKVQILSSRQVPIGQPKKHSSGNFQQLCDKKPLSVSQIERLQKYSEELATPSPKNAASNTVFFNNHNQLF